MIRVQTLFLAGSVWDPEGPAPTRKTTFNTSQQWRADEVNPTPSTLNPQP
jgi:hypothetical protein